MASNESPDARRRREQMEEVDKLLEQIYKKEATSKELLRKHEAGARQEFRRALETSAEVVPNEHEPEPIVRERLTNRHNSLVRAPMIAEAILALKEGDHSKLDYVREIIKNYGAFLKIYSPDIIHERLTSPQWVVTEAQGQVPPDEERTGVGQIVKCADCQCKLPSHSSELVIRLPEGKDDEIIEAGIFEEILYKPGIAMSEEDICVEDNMAGLGLASAALAKAFEVISSREDCQEIHYSAAEIFQIEGLIRPNGEEIHLKHFHRQPSIANQASLVMHDKSRFPIVRGWVLKRRDVPVVLPGDDPKNPHVLMTNWHVLIATSLQPEKK